MRRASKDTLRRQAKVLAKRLESIYIAEFEEPTHSHEDFLKLCNVMERACRRANRRKYRK